MPAFNNNNRFLTFFAATYDTVHRGDLRGKKLALGTTILSAFLYT